MNENYDIIILGGGIAGMNAALNLGKQGFEVVLVEKEPELGGFARNLRHASASIISQYQYTLVDHHRR